MIFFLINVVRHLAQRLRRLLGGRDPDPESGPGTGPPDPTHKRVVILGGGVAGVCAAFWLSAPQQRGRYQITLYTQGWRLGGKCASGRNAEFDRVEEHGLHVLLGCYHNAFATLCACYRAWQRPPTHPFRSWRDAFKPQRSITLMERDGAGTPPGWATWDFGEFPALHGEPGDDPADPVAGLDSCYLLLLNQLEAFAPHLVPAPGYSLAVGALRQTITDPQILADAQQLALDASAGLAQTVMLSESAQRLAVLARLGLAIARGYVTDVFGGDDEAIDTLNQRDFRAWLRDNGADHIVLDCAPVRAIYDLGFAYKDGDASDLGHGSIAAGVTLRFILEVVFGYRDAPLWRMVAGTGDTVFVPMYRVLQQRGVDIKLFHRVTALRPSADGTLLGEIELAKQVETKGGQPYDPFRKLGELDVWPNQPKWELLDAVPVPAPDYEHDCTASVGPPIILAAGTAFDLAIVALPPPVLDRVAAPLVAISDAWQIALGQSCSVATQALQLWLRPDAAGLGWTLPPAILTAYAKPFDSWADMSVLLRYENWPPQDLPCSIAYLCGCLKVGDPGSPATAADAWLTAHAAALWPAAPPAATWSDPGGPLLRRYDRANTEPAERYIQTPHGDNVASRLRPDQQAGFTNLYAVGDWTRTRFSGGCFESAVESAMLAANAISGFPARASIKTA